MIGASVTWAIKCLLAASRGRLCPAMTLEPDAAADCMMILCNDCVSAYIHTIINIAEHLAVQRNARLADHLRASEIRIHPTQYPTSSCPPSKKTDTPSRGNRLAVGKQQGCCCCCLDVIKGMQTRCISSSLDTGQQLFFRGLIQNWIAVAGMLWIECCKSFLIEEECSEELLNCVLLMLVPAEDQAEELLTWPCRPSYRGIYWRPGGLLTWLVITCYQPHQQSDPASVLNKLAFQNQQRRGAHSTAHASRSIEALAHVYINKASADNTPVERPTPRSKRHTITGAKEKHQPVATPSRENPPDQQDQGPANPRTGRNHRDRQAGSSVETSGLSYSTSMRPDPPIANLCVGCYLALGFLMMQISWFFASSSMLKPAAAVLFFVLLEAGILRPRNGGLAAYGGTEEGAGLMKRASFCATAVLCWRCSWGRDATDDCFAAGGN
ncbi:hypothetical protein Nepgr_006700 [Nepenthes gracilis]|uniref:Uncharacterized protein n=1 Tax=Nepenthes gracilis TaxID=150966 RepID=A0AAD3XHP3_NEPGR|nr:hypothetical protein Nepgr_006700 [Nepenthes gracilis]